MSRKDRDCQGMVPDPVEIMMGNLKWIRENVPVIVYPEEKGTIEKDREKWRKRIQSVLFILRR